MLTASCLLRLPCKHHNVFIHESIKYIKGVKAKIRYNRDTCHFRLSDNELVKVVELGRFFQDRPRG